MHIWRIAVDAAAYRADDLSGEGARRSGGRWNRVGSPLVYASASIALACLETLVHLGAYGLPLRRHLVRIDIPQHIWGRRIDLSVADVPKGWDDLPASEASRVFGESWVASRKTALVTVPSIVVPEERNVLINPLHPDAKYIVAEKVRLWRYDPRLVAAAD